MAFNLTANINARFVTTGAVQQLKKSLKNLKADVKVNTGKSTKNVKNLTSALSGLNHVLRTT